MDPSSAAAGSELAAAYLQLAVTLGLVVLCAILQDRYGKSYFGLWAFAWAIYAFRLISIVELSRTGRFGWLFWHQASTGWTALALLWAALVFSQGLTWRPAYAAIVFIPPVWAYLSTYVLDSFAWGAWPTVIFLSATTAWTAWVFLRYDRMVRSPAARFLGFVFALWALHHLDYPMLRGRPLWAPWGSDLDILFTMGMGVGIIFLVLEDLEQGLGALTSLSGELQAGPRRSESMAEAMLRRALSLRGVHGSALWLSDEGGGRFVRGAGVAALWPFEGAPFEASSSAAAACTTGTPRIASGAGRGGGISTGAHAYTAALPILSDDAVIGALVVVGDARDPFTALDNRFLLAFGHQVGAALANEELHESLQARREELERLQSRMVRQHEEERSRLWRELHDETAQVLAALSLQLGLVEERGDPAIAPALSRAKTLLADGIKSIRSVTRDLRPMALDDLGLVPALRALARDFRDHDAFEVSFDVRGDLPPLTADAEVALYRSLQEALANAARHGGCRKVTVHLDASGDAVQLTITDDGAGFPADAGGRLRSRGGLAGIRERITALGGELAFGNVNGGGARVNVRIPVRRGDGLAEVGNR